MKELLDAQKEGQDLHPHPSSRKAAELPDPKYPLDSFPGHAAWISGNWKLHRIQEKGKEEVSWELYDLDQDPIESHDLLAGKASLASRLQLELEGWLQSVTLSMNGEDY